MRTAPPALRLHRRTFPAPVHGSGLSVPNLRWLNMSGAYKISDGAMQCLLSTHTQVLLYNKPELFGTPAHEFHFL